jgi:hypothetical protein
MDEDLFSTLKLLALTIKRTIDDGISDGTLMPEEEVYLRWKVDKFQYTDKGVIEQAAHGEYVTKPSWFRTSFKLTESIKKFNEYNSAFERLTNVFGKGDVPSKALEAFVRKLVQECLHKSFLAEKFEENDIDNIIKIFLKDLHEEPVRCGAKIELEGVTLRPDKVELSYGITLRKTKIEDIEKEFPAFSFTQLNFPSKPSAILNIEFFGRPNEIQRKVEQAITILRLFKVGSVTWTRYHMFSDSIIDPMANATVGSNRIGTAYETYLITEEEAPKLKKFWQTISNIMPSSFFELDKTRIDHLTVAYNRYTDSLFQNGILERRIANAVMGLEALILKPGEIQELPYRLGIRVSKIFALLEYDPHETKKAIIEAYKVRNLFAHGGQLNDKGKKKLESRYKDPKNLLLSILNYLRILIIIMVISKRKKDEFIDLVDNSLIDRKYEEQLNGVISQVKEILW